MLRSPPPVNIIAGVNLISDALPFGKLWYTEIPHAIGYAQFYSRSHDAVIRVYDDAGNVIETHEHAGDFKEWWILLASHDTSRYTDFHDSAFTG